MKHRALSGVLLSGLIVFALIALPAAAHPPSDIVLSYDPSTSNLNVTIAHSVRDPVTHYIDQVTIAVDGVGVLDLPYTSQPTNDTFAYTYSLAASEGETISVLGICNLGGDLTRTLVVGGATTRPTTMTPPTTTQSPAFSLWAGIAGLLVAGYALHLRR